LQIITNRGQQNTIAESAKGLANRRSQRYQDDDHPPERWAS
jgi:hypothetical protein